MALRCEPVLHHLKAFYLFFVCVYPCNPSLNSISSHQSQQVSMEPSTGNGLSPTGRPSSRLWLAWLTRTHLAPRPWPRGKRPVWISSNSCWLGPTQIWVRDTHPKVSTYLSVCVTMCALSQSTCLYLYISLLLSSLVFFLRALSHFLLLLTLSLLTPSASCAALLTMLWVGKSSSHLDMQITRGKKYQQQQKQMTGLCSNQTTGLYCLSNPRDFVLLPLPSQRPWNPCRQTSLQLTLCSLKPTFGNCYTPACWQVY